MLAERTTFADVVERLGGIPLDRIRFDVRPGRANLRDLVILERKEDRYCELVDGLLVEKPMGAEESNLSAVLLMRLGNYLANNDIGFLLGEQGTLEILPNLVRIPDVSFISWRRYPERTIPTEPVPDLVPDLAVEIISRGNTVREMERKRKEYFLAGTALVWQIDGRKREVEVYISPEEKTVLAEKDTLRGGKVLPGFVLPLKQLFAKLAPKKKGKGR